MSDDLQAPKPDDAPNWASIYRSRGDEVEENRPVFTGDVFKGLSIHGLDDQATKMVMVVQHPCALRTDGVQLSDRVLVVEVLSYEFLSQQDWVNGHHKVMPLPELVVTPKMRHFAGFFKKLWLVAAEDVDVDKRIACLTQAGVNLLLQRWVHHNSRVVVETDKYQAASSGPFAEADLVEDWCEERISESVDRLAATAEAHEWLRSALATANHTWQELLESPQTRSEVTRQSRDELRRLRQLG